LPQGGTVLAAVSFFNFLIERLYCQSQDDEHRVSSSIRFEKTSIYTNNHLSFGVCI